MLQSRITSSFWIMPPSAVLLRKVGGGYMFIHRMLLEYFAAQCDESSVEATPNAKPSQIAIEM